MHSHSYDIIIVGGGIAGLSLACALAEYTPLSIAVLEAKSQIQAWSASHYFHRVSAITLSSQRIFQSLGIWDNLRKKRVSPFSQIEVWDAQGKGEIQFNSKDIAEPLLGYIIENNLIQSELAEKIKQYPQITFITPVTLKTYIEKENSVELAAVDHRVFKAKLAIAADGANSWLRLVAGIHLSHHDYEQEAIVAMVNTEKSHHQIARQVFLNTGPLAFLPLAGESVSSIVWSLPADRAKRLMTVADNLFKHELAEAFAYRLGGVIDLGQRYAFPLSKQQAHAYIKSRLALVGDAAHTIHPLAGQGVNMGLLDIACLVQVIVDAIENQRDFAATSVLRRYERWRKADNFSLLMGVDIIKHLFASNKKSIQQLRSLGLTAANRTQWLKNIFTQHAVGGRSSLPSMAKL